MEHTTAVLGSFWAPVNPLEEAVQVASATANGVDDEALRRVVGTSERLARLVPETPEYMGQLGPQRHVEVSSLAAATASLTAEERAQAVNHVTGPAAERGLVSTGFLPHSAAASAAATSRGLFAYDRSSRVSFTTTVRTLDGTGSGWAGSGSHDWADLAVRAIAERAIGKAERSRNPRKVEPGRWTPILEPTAAANMVNLMMDALGARLADEGRSFFSRPGGGNRIGRPVRRQAGDDLERFGGHSPVLCSSPREPRPQEAHSGAACLVP